MTSIDSRQTAVRAIARCALGLAASVALAGCHDVHGETAQAPRPVKVMEARPPDAPAAARYAVSITPYEQIPLAFKAAGYVDHVLQRRGADGRLRALQAGDVVPAGAVLARVREAEYRERLNQATGALHELDAAKTKATLDLERARTLFAAQALTRPELDAAQAAVDANLARIAQATAQIESARLALGDTALAAPRDGVILDRKIEIGSLVAGGSPGFVLADVSAVKAVFGVPDSTVHRLTEGQRLAVTTEAFHGRTFTGRITAISPSADASSRVFDVEITIPNGDRSLRPGMIGAVEVLPDAPREARDAMAPSVPLASVVRGAKPDEYAVFVVAGGAADAVVHSRAVTLGAIEGNLVAVTSGIEPGERVVVMGANLLQDGEMVRVIP